MEREPDAGIGGSPADLVEIPRKCLGVRRAQVVGTDSLAQIDLQMRATEVSHVTGAGGIALNRLLQP
jgi:hypothetical protein